MLDHAISESGSEYDDLPETYIIFITEHDIFKRGLQMYHVDRMVRELNEPFDDGQHIIYVNSTYQPDTPLGRVMHDFHCRSADDMYTKQLADRMREIKTDRMEAPTMSELVRYVYAEEFEAMEKNCARLKQN